MAALGLQLGPPGDRRKLESEDPAAAAARAMSPLAPPARGPQVSTPSRDRKLLANIFHSKHSEWAQARSGATPLDRSGVAHLCAPLSCDACVAAGLTRQCPPTSTLERRSHLLARACFTRS